MSENAKRDRWEVRYTKVNTSTGKGLIHGGPEVFDSEFKAWRREAALWRDPAVKTVKVRKVI